jgi:hypothetical protein
VSDRVPTSDTRFVALVHGIVSSLALSVPTRRVGFGGFKYLLPKVGDLLHKSNVSMKLAWSWSFHIPE